jgi:uncharacterized protein YihD (DUF1040 family)
VADVPLLLLLLLLLSYLLTDLLTYLFTDLLTYLLTYRGSDKSLARPGRKQATTEDFDVRISYL